jgi:hypothetical protein
MNDLPEIVVRNHDDLVDAFATVKNHLNLSNEVCDELAGLCKGHMSKILGRQKRVGPWLLGILCELLAVELVVRVNPEALKRMEKRWEQRDCRQIRVPHAVSQAVLDRYAPAILSALAKKGWKTRRAGRNGHNAHNGHNHNGHAR